jgi:hypothetical protein
VVGCRARIYPSPLIRCFPVSTRLCVGAFFKLGHYPNLYLLAFFYRPWVGWDEMAPSYCPLESFRPSPTEGAIAHSADPPARSVSRPPQSLPPFAPSPRNPYR